jgi:hypothetical protein
MLLLYEDCCVNTPGCGYCAVHYRDECITGGPLHLLGHYSGEL